MVFASQRCSTTNGHNQWLASEEFRLAQAHVSVNIRIWICARASCEESSHRLGLCVWLCLFVCVFMSVYGVTKKCLFTHLPVICKGAYCTLIHFMSPEMFARSIELYREHYPPCFFSDWHLGVSGIFRNIMIKTLPSLVTPTVWLNRNAGKASPWANPNMPVHWNLNSLYSSPLTVLSMHRVCILWNSSYTCNS